MKKFIFIFIGLFILSAPGVAEAYQYPYYEPVPQQYIPIMGYGTSGLSVTYLQQLLQRLGYFPAYTVPTGYYGTTTVRAVQSFQRAHGLVAAGYVGPNTQVLLSRYVMNTPHPQPYQPYPPVMPYIANTQPIYQDPYQTTEYQYQSSDYQYCTSIPCQVRY